MNRAANLLSRLAGAAALLLGVGCLVAAVAAQGGRVNDRLDLLTHFTLFWLAGALVVTAYGLVFARARLRWVLVGAGVAGVIASAVLMLPELTRPIRGPIAANTVVAGGAFQIKLIQFNAWEHNTDPQGAADWLASQNPDFITMDDAEPPIRLALLRHGFFPTRGIADTMIFSRGLRSPSPFPIPLRVWPFLPSFARATFPSPAGPFSILAVHLTRPTDPTQMQWALPLADLIDHYDRRRLIIAGDFNLTPWSFGLRKLDGRFGLERRDRALPTWPAWLPLPHQHHVSAPFPVLPIDHIYAGQAWRTVNIQRGPRVGSDHYPLIVTLALSN